MTSSTVKKRQLKLSCMVLLCTALSIPALAASPATVRGLKCEYLISPLGIDAPHPRLTWMLNDDSAGAMQSAYQLVVGTDSVAVNAGKGNMLQTAVVRSDLNLLGYQGKPLQAFTKYFWKVMLWDKAGHKVSSSTTSFEMGMMSKYNWSGFWISDKYDMAVKPAPYFRNVFNTAKAVKSARAYIAVGGLYELYINGQKIGNHRLDPMYTRFDRRTMYVTYDVTPQLKGGANAIGVVLGNGWYNHQSTAVWDFHKAPWRNRPKFCMDLRITYTDGTTQTVATNDTWETSLGPIIFNSIYTAEHYDARLEQPGWNTAEFSTAGKKWAKAGYRSAPSANVVSQAMQPIRNVETIPSKRMVKFDDKDYLFDIGRNVSGVSSITVTGEAGTVLRLRHAERLYKNGHTDQSNIDLHYRPTDDKDPYQTDIFILSGHPNDTFMPKFNYKGFQYVEVTSDKPIELKKESLTGYFMHSDVAPIGKVSSSSNTIDQIWSATNNSYLSNLFGYPTDCPQREKNGWTGDAHIAIETGLYSFDAITIYEKWMADHRDEQQPNGVLPSIIPTGGWGYDWGNGPDWTSTVAIIPYNLYLFYGDSKALMDNYEAIKRYVNHIDELYPTGITTWGLGDWVPVKSRSPVEFTSTIYYYTDVTILAKAAKLAHNTADEAKYNALALKIKTAFNAKYLNTTTGVYDKGYQTEQSTPLYWGIAPDNMKAKIAAVLADKVKADNYHLDAGILGAKAILGALSDAGFGDVAYKVASQETEPSWGWWIVNGATTLYENWNIDAKADISLNHIMFGEIGAWLYKGIGGIKADPARPGFKNVILQPYFVDGLTHYESTHDGPFGKIESSWKRDGNTISYHVIIPANSTATLSLPALSGHKLYKNGALVSAVGSLNLPSGNYQFEIK